MKIAHFVSNFPQNNLGEAYGKSLAAYNLCRELFKQGHQVHVFTISQGNKNITEENEGVKIHRYKPLASYKSESISFRIFTDSLKYDFDIIHIHSGISVTVLAGYLYAVLKKKPLIITWHGDSVTDSKSNRYVGLVPRIAASLYKYWINIVLSRADRIISVSKAYINESRFLKKYQNKITIIPNGIDMKSLETQCSKEECKNKLGFDGKKVVLFLGSLYDIKGPQVLLKAIPEVIKNEKDVVFVFAGGGDIEKYKSLAEKLNIAKHTKFVGYVTKEKPIYYKSADVFVLPSLSECFPLVLLEAMACEVPIVASKVGGVPDIIEDGKNGMHFLSNNHTDLGRILLHLLSDETSRKKIGFASKAIISRYSWKTIAKETETLYQNVACGQAGVIV